MTRKISPTSSASLVDTRSPAYWKFSTIRRQLSTITRMASMLGIIAKSTLPVRFRLGESKSQQLHG